MNNYLKNIILLAMAGMASLSAVACSSSFEAEDKQAMMQKIVVPKTTAQKQSLYDYLLSEQGIDIIKMGETRIIVIASDSLFVPGSANLNTDYARYLKLVAQWINTYDTTSVSVSAYTDENGDVARALTERQAQRVFTDLEKFGVKPRLMYAKGYGSANPVSIKNQSTNRRIEIKFQFHPQTGNAV